jgi:hypothetical protein
MSGWGQLSAVRGERGDVSPTPKTCHVVRPLSTAARCQEENWRLKLRALLGGGFLDTVAESQGRSGNR